MIQFLTIQFIKNQQSKMVAEYCYVSLIKLIKN